ncbi:MAG: agmatinase [Rhodoferax sp.]|nr:agmatinase [Rhodoferax sp.]
MIKTLHQYPGLANPQLRPRYAGVATFFRTPLRDDAQDVDIGVIGIPFDGGVTHRTGARHGPRAVRDQSTLIRRVHQATGVAPFDGLTVADLGDAWLERPYELQGALREIEEFFGTVHAAGTVPLSVGGDHSVTLPVLRAIARDRPVGLVHIDAHCDTGDDYLGSRFHHGAPFRRAAEEGLIDPRRTIQIGIRGSVNDPAMWQFSQDSGMRVVYIEEFDDKGWQWAAEEARRVVGDGPAYLSFDVDGLDPVFAPGTGTPESGGISMREAQRFLRALEGMDFIGGDVVEVSPPFDPSGVTAMNAANILFEILCLLSTSLRRRR